MGRISKYTAVTALDDATVFVIVKGGVTYKVTWADIKAGALGEANALVYKGAINCAANPNYPAADAGHVYIVSVAGHIGGASGPVVAVGDMAICKTDGNGAGNEATVGANWNVYERNQDIEPATAENDMLFGGPSPFGWIRKTLAQAKAILFEGASALNSAEKIQYPVPVSGYMLKAAADGSPGQGTNTDTDIADGVSKKHSQNTDTGTTATGWKINTGGNEADIQTTGLSADRDFTLPDIDTMLAGSVLVGENAFEIIAYT